MKTSCTISILAFSLFTVSCDLKNDPSGQSLDPSYVGVTDADFYVVPDEALTFNTKVDLVNFESPRREKDGRSNRNHQTRNCYRRIQK